MKRGNKSNKSLKSSTKLHSPQKAHPSSSSSLSSLSRLHTIHTHRFPSSRTFSSTTRQSFPPYEGLHQLKSSSLRLHIPSTDHIALSTKQVMKLADLTYLNPPQTRNQIEVITRRTQSIVDMLSKITHVDTTQLSNQQRKITESKSTTHEDELTFSNPASIPFFTPLPHLTKHVPPEAIAIHNTIDNGNGQTSIVDRRKNLLRLRSDDITEGGNTAGILRQAPFTDRGFYVVPKSNTDDLDE